MSIEEAVSASLSLMLAPTEKELLAKALQEDPIVAKKMSSTSHTSFFLSGIMFFDKKRWTIWINHQCFTEESSPNDFTIEKVTTDCVTLRFQKRTFVLKTNQTLIPATQTIIDGQLINESSLPTS